MTPPAIAAGKAIIARRFNSGVRRGRCGTMRNPARDAAIQTSTSCATPASGTPQASAMPISAPNAAPVSMAITNMMLSTTGAAAAAVNRPSAFNTPDSSAAREMNRI